MRLVCVAGVLVGSFGALWCSPAEPGPCVCWLAGGGEAPGSGYCKGALLSTLLDTSDGEHTCVSEQNKATGS